MQKSCLQRYSKHLHGVGAYIFLGDLENLRRPLKLCLFCSDCIVLKKSPWLGRRSPKTHTPILGDLKNNNGCRKINRNPCMQWITHLLDFYSFCLYCLGHWLMLVQNITDKFRQKCWGPWNPYYLLVEAEHIMALT